MNIKLFTLLSLLAFAAAEFPAAGSPAWTNDNNVLQYALSLELLESNFYTVGLQTFNQTQFTAAGYPANVFPFLEIIRDHEAAHVAALTMLLQARGQTPVTACNYTFGYSTVSGFLAVGAALEATGVMAYDGAIDSITQTDLIVLATSVASVEARHAAFLNIIVGTQPFFNATDSFEYKSQIYQTVNNFINGSCTGYNTVNGTTLLNASNLRPSNVTNGTLVALAYENDNNVLRFALLEEQVELAFFTEALQNISQASFTEVAPATAYELYGIIRQHELAHVTALQALLTARNASAVAACSQNLFSFNDSAASALEFIELSQILETVGLDALIGGSMLITDPSLLQLAATLVTVEARHISFERTLLANVTGDEVTYVPFPNVTDTAATPQMALASLAQFVNLNSCPSLTLPVAADSFRSNYTSNFTSSSSATNSQGGGGGGAGTNSESSASGGSASGGSASEGSASRSASGSEGSASSNNNNNNNNNSKGSVMIFSLLLIAAGLVVVL